MFKSFFPSPRLFFSSFVVYSIICSLVWYAYNLEMGELLGLDLSESKHVIGLGHFVTDSFLLFYIYYFVCTGLFAAFWFKVAKHKWQWWSIIGSAFILFSTYYGVQVSVAINNWRRPFFDLVQNALGASASKDPDAARVVASEETISSVSAQLFDLIVIFAEIAFLAIFVYVVTRFFVSHFVFRWRTAMNEYYTARWAEVRHI